MDSKIKSDLDKYTYKKLEYNQDRPSGKRIKYKLGTCVKYHDYILVAFSKFNEDNNAYLNLDDFLGCIVNFWIEVNKLYNEENIVIPLLGSGITRIPFKGFISNQKLLKIILEIFEFSSLSFSSKCTITIVISPNLKDDINFNEI